MSRIVIVILICNRHKTIDLIIVLGKIVVRVHCELVWC
jgi:hypothetical protein